eukprot:COSAG01_NODE_1138_length_11546_cov_11.035206_8_plen_232_part_00
MAQVEDYYERGRRTSTALGKGTLNPLKNDFPVHKKLGSSGPEPEPEPGPGAGAKPEFEAQARESPPNKKPRNRGAEDIERLRKFNDILREVQSGLKDLSTLEAHIEQKHTGMVAPLVLKHVLFDLTQPNDDLGEYALANCAFLWHGHDRLVVCLGRYIRARRERPSDWCNRRTTRPSSGSPLRSTIVWRCGDGARARARATFRAVSAARKGVQQHEAVLAGCDTACRWGVL